MWELAISCDGWNPETSIRDTWRWRDIVPVQFTENGKIAYKNKDKAKIYQLKYIELSGEGASPLPRPYPQKLDTKMCGPAIFILAQH